MEWPLAKPSCFFDRKLAEDFDYRCKQAGQLALQDAFSIGALGRHDRDRSMAAQCGARK